jgi:hypothetical protein
MAAARSEEVLKAEALGLEAQYEIAREVLGKGKGRDAADALKVAEQENLLAEYVAKIREKSLTINGRTFEEASANLGFKRKLALARRMLEPSTPEEDVQSRVRRLGLTKGGKAFLASAKGRGVF